MTSFEQKSGLEDLMGEVMSVVKNWNDESKLRKKKPYVNVYGEGQPFTKLGEPRDATGKYPKDGGFGAPGYNPLGTQSDLFTVSCGLACEDSDMRVRAENVAIPLPGDVAKDAAGGNVTIWEDFFAGSEAEIKTKLQKHAVVLDGRSRKLNSIAQSGVKKLTLLDIASSIVVKMEDGEVKSMKVNTIKLTSAMSNGGNPLQEWDGKSATPPPFVGDTNPTHFAVGHFVPWQNLVPFFPTFKLELSERERRRKIDVKVYDETFKHGEEVPDYRGVYLQWGECDKIILNMMCSVDEDDEDLSAMIELPGSKNHIKDAAVGYLKQLRKWLLKKVGGDTNKEKYKEFLGADFKFEDAETMLKTLEGELEDNTKKSIGRHWTDSWKLLSEKLPHYKDSYFFPESVGLVQHDPHHPLSINKLNAHYMQFIVRKLADQTGERLPSLSMARSYNMAVDRFVRVTHSERTAGLYKGFPLKTRFHKRLQTAVAPNATESDNEGFARAMEKFTMAERMNYMITYMSMVVQRVRLQIRASSKIDSGSGETDYEAMRLMHRKLRMEEMPLIQLVFGYATKVNTNLHEASRVNFDDKTLKEKGLSEYDAFEREPVLVDLLTHTLGLCLYCYNVLGKKIEKITRAKRNVYVPDDQILGAVLAGTEARPGLINELKAKISSAHSRSSVLASAGMIEGQCKSAAIHGKLFNTDTWMPIKRTEWELVADKGSPERYFKFHGPNKDKLEALRKAGKLAFDCNSVAVVFTDDVKNPVVLPQVVMSAKLTKMAMQANPGKNVLVRDYTGKYKSAKAGQLLAAMEAAVDASKSIDIDSDDRKDLKPVKTSSMDWYKQDDMNVEFSDDE